MYQQIKRIASSKVSRVSALSALVLALPALQAQTGSSTGSPSSAFRAGAREFYVGFTYFTAPDLVVRDIEIEGIGTYDARMRFDDNDVWGFGFGFGVNERVNVNGEFNYGAIEYDMIWGPYALRGTGDMFDMRFNIDYNLLTGPITPFVTAGVGYMYFDSGVPEGEPDIICWWDPWWGYVCDGYVDTHSSSEFTWNLGAGLRWDPTDTFFIKALYDVTWMEVGASGTEAFPEYQIQVGWKW